LNSKAHGVVIDVPAIHLGQDYGQKTGAFK
jgi:hypothetical protein